MLVKWYRSIFFNITILGLCNIWILISLRTTKLNLEFYAPLTPRQLSI